MVLALSAASWLACQSPTQIVVNVSTDVACSQVKGTQVSVGTLGAALELAEPSTSTPSCSGSPGHIGTLVLVPGGSGDEEVAIKVVMGIDRPPAECAAANYAGCIVARRSLHFVQHGSISLDVAMGSACASMPCDATSTCAGGRCIGAVLTDPETCTDPATCNDGGSHDGGTVVVDAAVGSDAPAPPSESGVDSGVPVCAGAHGPSAVMIDAGTRRFCIDSTEVSRAQYLDFLGALSSSAQPPPLPASCAWKTSFLPNGPWPPAPNEVNLPVVWVDWCAAYAYCQWAGKRLCGSTASGGAIKVTQSHEQATNAGEMYYACSRGGAQSYPYGDVENTTYCNTGLPDGGRSPLVDVGSMPHCEGGYPGIFDLSGNVTEWQNACESDDVNATCYQGAGSNFKYTDDFFACGVPNDSDPRQGTFEDLGIRCCSDPVAP